jgi:hypothetical protein
MFSNTVIIPSSVIASPIVSLDNIINTILFWTIHRGKLWNNFQGSLSTFTVLDREEGSHWTGASVHNIGIGVLIYTIR